MAAKKEVGVKDSDGGERRQRAIHHVPRELGEGDGVQAGENPQKSLPERLSFRGAPDKEQGREEQERVICRPQLNIAPDGGDGGGKVPYCFGEIRGLIAPAVRRPTQIHVAVVNGVDPFGDAADRGLVIGQPVEERVEKKIGNGVAESQQRQKGEDVMDPQFLPAVKGPSGNEGQGGPVRRARRARPQKEKNGQNERGQSDVKQQEQRNRGKRETSCPFGLIL